MHLRVPRLPPVSERFTTMPQYHPNLHIKQGIYDTLSEWHFDRKQLLVFSAILQALRPDNTFSYQDLLAKCGNIYEKKVKQTLAKLHTNWAVDIVSASEGIFFLHPEVAFYDRELAEKHLKYKPVIDPPSWERGPIPIRG